MALRRVQRKEGGKEGCRDTKGRITCPNSLPLIEMNSLYSRMTPIEISPVVFSGGPESGGGPVRALRLRIRPSRVSCSRSRLVSVDMGVPRSSTPSQIRRSPEGDGVSFSLRLLRLPGFLFPSSLSSPAETISRGGECLFFSPLRPGSSYSGHEALIDSDVQKGRPGTAHVPLHPIFSPSSRCLKPDRTRAKVGARVTTLTFPVMAYENCTSSAVASLITSLLRCSSLGFAGFSFLSFLLRAHGHTMTTDVLNTSWGSFKGTKSGEQQEVMGKTRQRRGR